MKSLEDKLVNLGIGLVLIWAGTTLYIHISYNIDFLSLFCLGSSIIIFSISYIYVRETNNVPWIPILISALLLVYSIYLFVGKLELFMSLILIVIGIIIVMQELVKRGMS